MAAGYRVNWLRQLPLVYTAEVARESASYDLHPAAEWRALITSEPLDPQVVTAQLNSALEDAEAFVLRMPTEKLGLLFLNGGQVVQPDPDRLEHYQTHGGQRRGHWPSSPEITAAMLERYKQKPIRRTCKINRRIFCRAVGPVGNLVGNQVGNRRRVGNPPGVS